jgi:hypothetical protein
VDTIRPTVTNITPANNAKNVSPVSSMTAVFSEAIDPATITSATFIVKLKQTGSTPVAATVTYDAATRKATLKPTTALANQTVYTVTLKSGASGIKDLAGNSLNADFTWTITTGTLDLSAPVVSLTSPANGASVTGQVTITASASDNVGVVSVKFYVDGQLLATDTSSPFSATWNTKRVSKTTHTIYAIATDAAGNIAQSATITVTVR